MKLFNKKKNILNQKGSLAIDINIVRVKNTVDPLILFLYRSHEGVYIIKFTILSPSFYEK